MSIVDITADSAADTGSQVPDAAQEETLGAAEWDIREVAGSTPGTSSPTAARGGAPDQVPRTTGRPGAPSPRSDEVGPAKPADSGVPGTRPTFTITEAATACSVSRKTITRKLADLAEHGAAKDEDGLWRIPVEALLAVGLHPGRSLPRVSLAPPARAAAPATTAPAAGRGESAPAGAGTTAADVVTIPRDRWDDLRLRLARAEAEAAERALALADARLALRALTAAPQHTSSPADSYGSLGAGAPAVIGGSAVPPAVGWVLGPMPAVVDSSDQPQADQPSSGDPGAAPPVAVLPPIRKRRWWQSAAR